MFLKRCGLMTDNNHPINPPLELVQQWLSEGRHQDYCSATRHAIAQAARWGNHPGSPDSSTPQPVPVSERLPGPGDCDAEGRCWWWYPEVPDKTYGYWAYEDDAVPERALNEQPLHWLPAHALPLPS
jgi:hypothetical protein